MKKVYIVSSPYEIVAVCLNKKKAYETALQEISQYCYFAGDCYNDLVEELVKEFNKKGYVSDVVYLQEFEVKE